MAKSQFTKVGANSKLIELAAKMYESEGKGAVMDFSKLATDVVKKITDEQSAIRTEAKENMKTMPKDINPELIPDFELTDGSLFKEKVTNKLISWKQEFVDASQIIAERRNQPTSKEYLAAVAVQEKITNAYTNLLTGLNYIKSNRAEYEKLQGADWASLNTEGDENASHLLGTYEILNYVNIDYDGIVFDKRHKEDGFLLSNYGEKKREHKKSDFMINYEKVLNLAYPEEEDKHMLELHKEQYDEELEAYNELDPTISPGEEDYVRPESINITTVGLPITQNTNVLADYMPMVADIISSAQAGHIFNETDQVAIGINLLIDKHSDDDVWQMMLEGNGGMYDIETGVKKYPSFLEELVGKSVIINGKKITVDADVIKTWKTTRPKEVVEAFKLYLLEGLKQLHKDNK